MKKTLSDLKRDIVVGTKLCCVDFVWCRTDRTLEKRGVPEAMQGIRTVESKNTVGFIVDGSHFGWPKASELEYIDNTIVVSPRNQNGDVFQIRTYKIVV